MASRTAYSTWTPQKPTLFDCQNLRNRSSLDIGVLGYIGIVEHKEHSPEILSIPPGTPCTLLRFSSKSLSEQANLLTQTVFFNKDNLDLFKPVNQHNFTNYRSNNPATVIIRHLYFNQ